MEASEPVTPKSNRPRPEGNADDPNFFLGRDDWERPWYLAGD